jgi:hypothetical protein
MNFIEKIIQVSREWKNGSGEMGVYPLKRP